MNSKAEPLPTALPKVNLSDGTRKEAVPCNSTGFLFGIYLDFIRIFCLIILVAFR